MTAKNNDVQSKDQVVTSDDVERVLAVGRLLLSVLTPEELEYLRDTLAGGVASGDDDGRVLREMGNAGVP